MNRILSNEHIKFSIWLISMVERSGLSCEACEGMFMIRHVSGLPLAEEAADEIIASIRDEADRLAVPLDIYSSSGKIWLALIGE